VRQGGGSAELRISCFRGTDTWFPHTASTNFHNSILVKEVILASEASSQPILNSRGPPGDPDRVNDLTIYKCITLSWSVLYRHDCRLRATIYSNGWRSKGYD
jgi:hypothetical protein